MKTLTRINKSPTQKMIEHWYPPERLAKYLKAVIESRYEFLDCYAYYLIYYFSKNIMTGNDCVQLRVGKFLQNLDIKDNETLGLNLNWVCKAQQKYRETGFLDIEELKYRLTDGDTQ